VALKATGGIAPYTYKVRSLPKGLTSTPAGVISGKPTKAGTKTVSITVTDGQAIPPTSAKVKLKLVVKS
jgi:Putative Ig domain